MQVHVFLSTHRTILTSSHSLEICLDSPTTYSVEQNLSEIMLALAPPPPPHPFQPSQSQLVWVKLNSNTRFHATETCQRSFRTKKPASQTTPPNVKTVASFYLFNFFWLRYSCLRSSRTANKTASSWSKRVVSSTSATGLKTVTKAVFLPNLCQSKQINGLKVRLFL